MENETKIQSVARRLIDEYRNNGRIYDGINGPYDDPEPRVRNLSHLIVIASIENKIQGGNTQVLEQMASDLKQLRNADGLYTMRNKPGKDHSNGVIGHAWVLEAFIYLYSQLKDEECLRMADELANKHVFSEKQCLWYVPKEAGRKQEIDYTFNHQLWYAASLAELNTIVNNSDYSKQLSSFMKNLPKIARNSKDGKIAHNIYCKENIKDAIKSIIKRNVDQINEYLNRPSMRYKEEGYHVFNMMALARLYRLVPNERIFNSDFFKNAVNYINSKEFLTGLMSDKVELDKSLHNNIIDKSEKAINIYGYPYNVPGFELKYIEKTFDHKYKIDKEIVKKCFNNQIELTYSDKTGLFTKTCHDKWAVNYRVYEYYRYLEIL